MAANILRLSEQGRHLYKTRRTCRKGSDRAGADEAGKRRVYVDGKKLQRASSSYVEHYNPLRADALC
jgi:hypothetical protein